MKNILAGVLLAITFGLVLSIGCANLPTQHQRIAATCEGIASGLDAATAAKQAGRISASQLQAVVDLATPTKDFCEPPAETLTPRDYAKLISAAAEIAASPGATP